MTTSAEASLLWEPSDQFARNSRMWAYMRWLEVRKGLGFEDYASLWAWSSTNVGAFWETVWQFFDVCASSPYTQALADRTMPGASARTPRTSGCSARAKCQARSGFRARR